MEELGLWRTFDPLRGDGPRGIAFDLEGNLYTNNHSGIFKIKPDGEVETLQGVQGSPIGSIAISPTDELYYTDRGQGKVYRWNPNGSSELIASDLPMAEHLLFGPDDTLFVTQMGYSDLKTINLVDGTSNVFAKDVCLFDPCFLAMDREGDIWVRAIWQITQLDPNGKIKNYIVDGQTYPGGPYAWHSSAGIAIDAEDGVWFGSYGSWLKRFVPTNPGSPDPEFTVETVSPGFEASDLSVTSNGDVIAFDRFSSTLVRIDQNKEVHVLATIQREGSSAVAVDSNDQIYLGKPDGEIVKVDESGKLVHYANILTRRMVFGNDGILYAVSGDLGTPKTVVAITGIDTYQKLTDQIDGVPLGTGEINITPAKDGGLYVFLEENRQLAKINFDGSGRVIADLSDADIGGQGPEVLASSPTTGKIYLITHGSYILVEMDPEGNLREYAYGVVGDPWGMVVSPDGKWIYVAESGAIDQIPLE